MARLPIPGSDDGQWGAILNGFLGVELNDDGSLKKAADIADAKAKADTAYQKPVSGVPKTDLDLSVQTTLDNADALVLGGIPDATATTTGGVRLTGDLTGTAVSPVLAPGVITDISVSSSAGIAQSKIANLTSDMAGKANAVHGHLISDITTLQTILDSKADGAATTAVLSTKADITSVTSQLALKADTASLALVATSGSYDDLINKPAAVTPPVTSVNTQVGDVVLTAGDVGAAALVHTHADATSSVSGFFSGSDKTKLDGVAVGATNYTHPSGDGNLHVPATGTTNTGKILKAGSTAGAISWDVLTSTDVGAAATNHTHIIADVTSLQTTLDSKAAITDLTTDLAGKADTSHTHTAADVTSGVFATAQIPTSILPPTGSISMWVTASPPAGWLLCEGQNVSRTTYAILFGLLGTTYGAGDGSTTFTLPNMKGRVAAGFDSGDASFSTMGQTGGEKAHTLAATEMPSHTHTQNSHTHTLTDPGHNHTQNSHNHTQNSHNHTQATHTHALTVGGVAAVGSTGSGLVNGGTAMYAAVGGVNNISADTVAPAINSATATNIATTATNIANTTGVTLAAAAATNQNTGGGGAHNNLQPYIVMRYIIKT